MNLIASTDFKNYKINGQYFNLILCNLPSFFVDVTLISVINPVILNRTKSLYL